MKFIYTITFVTIIFALSAFSQDTHTRIVKGKILDKSNGSPVGVEIQFEDARGKKFKIKSNPQTGEYEQLLNANEKYTLTFIDMNVLRNDINFTPSAPDASYEPEMKNFNVVVLKSGNQIDELDLFNQNSSNFSSNGSTILKDLKTMLRINRALYVNFEVCNDGSDNNINSARIESLKAEIAKWGRLGEKVNIKLSNKKATNSNSDLLIFVDKVEDSLK